MSKPQLNIYHSIIQPGKTYECCKSWMNEMGYKWKIGEKVIVEIVGIYHVQVRTMKEKQSFHLNIEKFIENFE